MKLTRLISLLLVVITAALALMACGEATVPEKPVEADIETEADAENDPDLSEKYDQPVPIMPDTKQKEDTEIPPEETESVVDFAEIELPIDLSECSIVPEDYDDHSAQLIALGYAEGTDEYALYDLLLDLSCKMAYYVSPEVNYSAPYVDNVAMFDYYRKYADSVETIARYLLKSYDIGYPDGSLLPKDAEAIDAYDTEATMALVKEIGFLAVTEKMQETMNRSFGVNKELIAAFKDCFSSELLADFRYTGSMLDLLEKTEDEMEFIDKYIEDPLRDEILEIVEEFDEELEMVRVTVTTTCELLQHVPLNTTFESYTVNEDGTAVLTFLIYPEKAFWIGTYASWNNPECYRIFCYNKIGMQIVTIFHSDYPFFTVTDEGYWDTPIRVENEQLHKSLVEFFTALKNDGTYTRRDLVYIRPDFNDYERYNSCQINFSYDKTEIKNYPNGDKMPRLYSCSSLKGRLGEISQADMDLFIMARFIKHL